MRLGIRTAPIVTAVSLVSLVCWFGDAWSAEPALKEEQPLVSSRSWDAIMTASDLRPGLAICVGADDGIGVLRLAADPRFKLVQGLSRDPTVGRAQLLAQEMLGRVTIIAWKDPKHLPYADDMVDLLVAEDPALELREAWRVVAPYGSLVVPASQAPSDLAGVTPQKIGAWAQFVKPYPADMDEWPQYGHDAAGTWRSRDQRVGPPNALRWIQSPDWTLDVAQPRPFVTAKGRTFCYYPDYQRLVARNAFNGLLEWEIPLLHENTPKNIDVLSTDGERVFVLDDTEHIMALRADTGAVAAHYPFSSGLLYRDKLLANRGLEIYDVVSGKLLWRLDEHLLPVDNRSIMGGGSWKLGMAPMPVVAEGDHLFYLLTDTAAEKEVRLWGYDLATGKRLWSAKTSGHPEALACVMDGLILTTVNADRLDPTTNTMLRKRQLRAYAAENGALRWECDSPGLENAHRIWLMRDGVLWISIAKPDAKGYFATKPFNDAVIGIDTKTGSIISKLNDAVGMWDSRCAPLPQVGRWMIAQGATTMYDPVGQELCHNKTMRTTCGTGVIPANGLFYQQANYCGCQKGVRGNSALAHESPLPNSRVESATSRLERGPAYERPITKSALGVADTWPCFRADNLRRNAVATEIFGSPQVEWECKLLGRPSQPVAVGASVFCAVPDANQVVALNAATGAVRWTFTADARVDSPPTWHDGRLVFGCGDGRVYCLDAEDGALCWRRLVAPAEKQIVDHDRLISAWPVPGSVTVDEQGVIYAAAGHHTDVDGGIFVSALDLTHGDERWRVTVSAPAATIQDGGAFINDVLIFSGDKLAFGNDAAIDIADGKLLLEAFNKTSWKYKPGIISGFLGFLNPLIGELPAKVPMYPRIEPRIGGQFLSKVDYVQHYWQGRLLVIDDTGAWRVVSNCSPLGNSKEVEKLSLEYAPTKVDIRSNLIYQISAGWSVELSSENSPVKSAQVRHEETRHDGHNVNMFVRGREGEMAVVDGAPIAMIRAGSRLFLAAPKADQGVLLVVDAATGAIQTQVSLPAKPCFDGMAAARGALYIATERGTLVRVSSPK